MKKAVILSLINLILVILQTSFFLELFGVSVNPNLVLAYSFSFIFMDRKEEVFLSAFIGGLLLNLIGEGIVGLSSMLMIVLAYGILFFRNYARKNIFVNFSAVFVSAILYQVIFDLLVRTSIDWKIIVSAFLTALISLLFYFVNNRLAEIFGFAKDKIK